MADIKRDSEAKPLDNNMPSPPASDDTVKPLDNNMPGEPADAVTTLDNNMPAPPALDLDGGT